MLVLPEAPSWKWMALRFATVALGTLAMAESNITYLDLKDQGISLITPTSSEFESEISRFVAPQARQALQSILPYSVLIRNSTATPWLAVCVTWELKNAKGVPIVHSMTIQTLLDDRDRMLLPGEYSTHGSQIWR